MSNREMWLDGSQFVEAAYPPHTSSDRTVFTSDVSPDTVAGVVPAVNDVWMSYTAAGYGFGPYGSTPYGS